ncbi:SDR family NAD(P)-dependent oxidoreductase [Scytonema sp. PCC 10023]|uniref:SDR family NAD(P)-dependent oxidoreductase n=1 Tax=Scytonema sp. PCC 10023 TaxID=1680591 RepID=UPI0039C62876
MSSNNKKVWLITGSSSGFGRALAEAVLKHGDRLIATARKPEQLNDLVSQYPETVKAVRLDITNKTAVKAAVDAALEAFGRIDVLVNNAGYGLIGALEEVSDEQIWRNFDTNLFGANKTLAPFLRGLGDRKRG